MIDISKIVDRDTVEDVIDPDGRHVLRINLPESYPAKLIKTRIRLRLYHGSKIIYETETNTIE